MYLQIFVIEVIYSKIKDTIEKPDIWYTFISNTNILANIYN